jgi:hypothetical protein
MLPGLRAPVVVDCEMDLPAQIMLQAIIFIDVVEARTTRWSHPGPISVKFLPVHSCQVAKLGRMIFRRPECRRRPRYRYLPPGAGCHAVLDEVAARPIPIPSN